MVLADFGADPTEIWTNFSKLLIVLVSLLIWASLILRFEWILDLVYASLEGTRPLKICLIYFHCILA